MQTFREKFSKEVITLKEKMREQGWLLGKYLVIQTLSPHEKPACTWSDNIKMDLK
jgi:hypothetical protein